MGKVLGGGSSINVSTWSRGHRADWDFYASEAGDPSWGYEAVLDLYRRRIEAWAGGPDPDYRGTRGMVHVQSTAEPHPFSFALLEGAESVGLQRFPNPNGRMMEAAAGGCAFVDETVRDRKRQSIFRSYVYPFMDQPNITVLTGALATRVLFHHRRGTGVEFHYQDLVEGVRTARAIGNSAALRSFTGREIAPGALNRTELEHFFRDGLVTFWHQCGTAKVGRDAMSVVDGKLKVYGVDGLRIADASIMPRVTTGNTMAPCVVIGEQAVTLLCSEHKLNYSSLNAAVETDLTQEKLNPVFDTSFLRHVRRSRFKPHQESH